MAKMQGRTRAKAEERRNAVIACRPSIPEGWEGAFAFYLRLCNFRRPGPSGPAPVTLEDVRALLEMTETAPAETDELLTLIPILETRYFEMREKMATPPPAPLTRRRG